MHIDHRRTDKLLKFKFNHISTGPFHAACVTEQGQTYTFGEGNYMKLGHNNEKDLPDRVSGLVGQIIRSTACGLDFTLALSNTGVVFS